MRGPCGCIALRMWLGRNAIGAAPRLLSAPLPPHPDPALHRLGNRPSRPTAATRGRLCVRRRTALAPCPRPLRAAVVHGSPPRVRADIGGTPTIDPGG